MTMPEPTASVDPAGENVIGAFIEYLNAGDFEGLAELLHPDVDCSFFETAGRAGVVEGFTDLALRYPALVYTRAELGDEPVAAVWGYGREAGVRGRQEGVFRLMGVYSFSFTDDDDALVEHIAFDDDPDPGAGLLAEEPDPADVPEGVDWLEWDAGEVGDED